MLPEYDLIIAGGGMIGASLACALGNTALRCCVIEPMQLSAHNGTTYDDRAIVLSQSSTRALMRLGVWPALAATAYPIKQIHVSEQGQFGAVRLHAKDAQLDALGHVVTARELGAALYQRLNNFDNIALMQVAKVTHFTLASGTATVQVNQKEHTHKLQSKLLVAADGSHSVIREKAGIACNTKDYKQTAIVATVMTTKANNYTAFQRFNQYGSIAVLPKDSHCSVFVLIVQTEKSAALLDMDTDTFIRYLQSQLQQLGKIKKIIGHRAHYPLQYIVAAEQYRANLVLLGNAAHSLHPNTAQSLNLGLRDVARLAEMLTEQQADHIGDVDILRQYYQQRRPDQQRIIYFSRLLSTLFYTTSLPKRLLRRQAMRLLAYHPYARSQFIRLLTGLAGQQANIICDPYDVASH